MNIKIFVIVFCFIVIDIFTGLIAAIKNGEYKSTIMKQGLWSKCGEIISMLLGACCEYAFPIVGIQIQIPIVSGIAVYLVIMEVGSSIENLTKISPNLKKVLGKYLGIYKNHDDENGD